MDIPAIQVVKLRHSVADDTLPMSKACELYLRLKGVNEDKACIRTANRNTGCVTKPLDNKPIGSYSLNEPAQFRDWCVKQGIRIKTVKRVFASVRAILKLAISEEVMAGITADHIAALAPDNFIEITAACRV